MSTRCFGVCLVSLLVLASGAAVAGEEHMHAMAKMTDAQVIESTTKAAPAAVGKDSTVIAVNEDGTIRTVRKGTNNFTCMADNPQTPGPDPMCGDANAMTWVNAWLAHQTPAGKPGFMYMLEGGTDASNTDPYATQPTAENHWIKTGPHIMIVGGDTTGYPRTPEPDTSKPYVMWPGTPYEHLMIPVK
jgi:hypothetical protein